MKGLTILEIMIAILIFCMIGGCVLTFKSCTDHFSEYTIERVENYV